MAYALIQDNIVVTYPLNLVVWREENPNISLPYNATEAQLNEQGIYNVLPTEQPTYNWITQSCAEGTPAEIDDLWYQTWVVTENTPEQIAANEALARQQNKDKASTLLTETDWTATVDINNPQYSNPYLGNQDAFLAYRSSVRQIAVNPPIIVEVWPVKPEEVWVTV